MSLMKSEVITITNPEFMVLIHKNTAVIDLEASVLCRDKGWYPVGGVGRKRNEWVQVIVRAKRDE
jgi:hypothetical protein